MTMPPSSTTHFSRAAGFVPKESTRSEILNAVLDCAKARRGVAQARVRTGRRDPQKGGTGGTHAEFARERSTQSDRRGSSVPAIAEQLFLAPSTVKTHVQRLYEKLGVGDRAAAVAEGMRRGLLD